MFSLIVFESLIRLMLTAWPTRRECAAGLAGWFGGGIYQIKRAGVVLEADARLARRVARLESQWKTGQ